jgi:3-oxoacyl-[acyl-carrier protein] reductase
MRLKGKVALVTGSSRGIGKAIALKLAEEGAKIGVHCLKNFELAQQIAQEIESNGGEAIVLKGDVAKPEVVEQMILLMVETFGKVDILVNNAGIIKDYAIAGLEDEEWNMVMAVNLTGTFNMCRSVAKQMIFQKSGKIINISSFVAGSGSRGQANYVASKGGVEALTRALAVELALKGITVNAVAPGAIETDMSKDAINKYKDKLLPNIPLRRIGTPGDVAGVVSFLASDEASYITGEVIRVTGGLGLWGSV